MYVVQYTDVYADWELRQHKRIAGGRGNLAPSKKYTRSKSVIEEATEPHTI